jgi:hypothetical protein
MKDFRENSHREHLYLRIDASPKELVSAIYRKSMQAACPGNPAKPPPKQIPDEIWIQESAIRHFSDVEKDVNKKVQCPNPALSYRVP